MNFSLHDKVAIVTGGCSGIGFATAKRFCEQGAGVLIADRRRDGERIAAEIGAQFHLTDVSDELQVIAAFETAGEAFGRINILVNNAGIQPLGVDFNQVTESILDRTFGVNVNGVAFGIKCGNRYLTDAGRIINMASFVGMIGVPGGTAYAASKAAVIHLTKLGAIELAPRKITVNAVSPGTIRTQAVTDIHQNPEIPFIKKHAPLHRLGHPEEVAALCQFLASDEAGYITGQNIAIDGGLTSGWTEYDLVAPRNVQNGRWVDDV